MAQRGNRVFITFEEFAEWAQKTATELSLVVLLDAYRKRLPFERWNGDIAKLAGADEVYFSMTAVELGVLYHNDVNPAERGWVYIDVPRVKDGALLLVELAARSDWWEDGMVKENPESIPLHGKLSRRLKKLVKYPTWFRGVRPPTDATLCRDVGYTEGAKAWYRNGGELMQDGVLNVRFEIRD